MQRESKKIKEEFGFDSEAEAVKEYHSLNRDFMYLNYPLIADEIISRLKLEKGTILDIGTGLGALAFEFARRLPQAKVYALDISPEMLAEAKRIAQETRIDNVELVCGDAHKLEFADVYFDLVVSFGILHHLRDIRLLFSEVKRVLKEKGVAYIYDLRKDAPEDIVSEVASGMNSAQKRAFLESVKEAFITAELEKILHNLGFSEFSLSSPKFSRRTIIKNMDLLKKSKLVGNRFNRIILEGFLRK